MRINTLLQHILFLIVLLLFVSCQDDDEIILFPNGSRELKIYFQEPFPGSEKFCFVTSEDGRLWWDTIYSANQSVKRVTVPLDQNANITLGARYVNATNFSLTTYRNIGEDFSIVGTVDLKCVGSPPAFGGTKTHVVIKGVNSAVELAQVGIARITDQTYLDHDKSFHFNCRPLTFGADTSKTYFFAIQELLSADVKGVSIPWTQLFKNDTLILESSTFKQVDRHIIEMPYDGFWDFSMQGILDETIYFFKSKQFASSVVVPSSKNIVLFVPEDVEFDEYSLHIYEPTSIDEYGSGLIYHGATIPQSISLFHQELENKGTTNSRIRYNLTAPSTLLQSRIRYQNLASWSVIQLGGADVDFGLPNLPYMISDAYPILGQSFAAPRTLEVTSYKMDSGAVLPINKIDIESIIDCQDHQYINMWEQLN